MMLTKIGRMFMVGAAIALLTAAAHAAEYNFYEQADKKGCILVITERGQDACAREQKKNEACSVAVECEVDKQERLIATYKDAKERLDRGNVADADKDRLKDTVSGLKGALDSN